MIEKKNFCSKISPVTSQEPEARSADELRTLCDMINDNKSGSKTTKITTYIIVKWKEETLKKISQAV